MARVFGFACAMVVLLSRCSLAPAQDSLDVNRPPLYVDPSNIPADMRAEDMAKIAPHIMIDGVKLDYAPELKHYVFNAIAKNPPFAGEKTRVFWMAIQNKDTGKTDRILPDINDRIDLTTGKQYERQPDGEWKFNGKQFIPEEGKPWTKWKQVQGVGIDVGERLKTTEIYSLTETEQSMLGQLNAFRVLSGLAPLTTTPEIMQRARSHAQWMTANHSMTHSAGIQENIAAGQQNVSAAMSAWINSGGHNSNMRTGNKECGVAFARANNGTCYWCQQFATGSSNWGKPQPVRAIVGRTAEVVRNTWQTIRPRRGLLRRR